MKQYYSQRNGLIDRTINLSDEELIDFFIHTYSYFDKKGYFDSAKDGVWFSKPYSKDIQILAPTFAPSPEVYFLNHLQDSHIWPIYEHAPNYTINILFTVIEILYDHIGYYDYENEELITDKPKKEFAEYINNILKMYNDGYYLESTQGFITALPNVALKHQLSYSGNDMPEDVFEKLSTASNMYYRFDAGLEEKKKAINILADIFENEREDIKDLLSKEYGINKEKHDKLVFDIVNNYNIRHNNAKQKTGYSREIWYDWMMQYYTSGIIAYYKLKSKSDKIIF